MPMDTVGDGPLDPSSIVMGTSSLIHVTGSEYSLLTHYQILTLFTGGEVSNIKTSSILLISEHMQNKGNICAIMEGIFKILSNWITCLGSKIFSIQKKVSTYRFVLCKDY